MFDDLIAGFWDALVKLCTKTTNVAELTFIRGRTTFSWASLVDKVWNYFAFVALGMTIIYFLLEMNRKLALEGRDLNIKSMFAPFLKLLISIGVLANGSKIVVWLMKLSDAFMLFADGLSNESYDVGGDLPSELTELSIFVGIVIILVLLLTFLVGFIVGVIWWYKAFTWKLEFLWRMCITPIALADVYSGQNGTAVKYLKGFLALGLTGMAMIILPQLAMVLSVDAVFSAPEGLSGMMSAIISVVKLPLAPIAAIGVFGVVKTTIKEALGA